MTLYSETGFIFNLCLSQQERHTQKCAYNLDFTVYAFVRPGNHNFPNTNYGKLHICFNPKSGLSDRHHSNIVINFSNPGTGRQIHLVRKGSKKRSTKILKILLSVRISAPLYILFHQNILFQTSAGLLCQGVRL